MFFLSFGLDWIAQSKQLIVELKKNYHIICKYAKKAVPLHFNLRCCALE